MTQTRFWTDERAELCKKLWADGVSAAEIARQLGDGCTRNAVVSKVHRNGWTGPNSWSSPQSINRPKTQKKPRAHALRAVAIKMKATPAIAITPAQQPATPPRPEAAFECYAEDGVPKSLITLKQNECRWPIGDPGQAGFGFCGGHKQSSVPYCHIHLSIAWTFRSYQKSTRETQA